MQSTQSKKTKKSKATGRENRPATSWVNPLADAIRQTQDAAESKIKTVLTFKPVKNKNSLFVPADMAEFQPRSLRYLQKFAAANNLTLVEDRRQVQSEPVLEKRSQKDPMMVLGMSMLLKQAGMPGPARTLSEPHRLNPQNPFFPITTLIDMAAFSASRAKRTVLPPNRITVKALDNDTQNISGYACNIKTDDATTLLSHFESDNLRAIGYSSGDQFVFHVCLGGGAIQDPALWTNLKTLQSTDFKFQLFAGKTPANDFGLFYSTLYLDLSQAPFPSWMIDKPATNDMLHQKDQVA